MKRPWLALAFVLSSCVTQSAYDKLQAECEEGQAQLEARNRSLREEEKSSESGKRTEAELRAEIDRLKERAKDLEARIVHLHTQLAEIVKDKSALEGSVTEMTAALAELEKQKEEADARIEEFKSLLEKFRTLIHAGKLKVKIVDGRMVVVLATDVLFGSGSAALSREGRAEVGEVARILATIPKRKLQVEGHTDNVRISTAHYPSNWELAAARAITVLKAMIESGMPADRISAASFGDSKPAASNDTAEGKGQNRRIEIVVVPDLSTLPGFDQLNRLGPSSTTLP